MDQIRTNAGNLPAEDLLSAANSASATARNAWLAFLLFLTYLVVTLASMTDEGLLRDQPIEMPVIDVKVAIRSFFVFGPILLLVLHLGIVIQHVMLARKLEAFNAALDDPFRQSPLRSTVHSYVFSQLAAGPPRSIVLSRAMQLMADVTLKMSGPLVLIYFLIAALPLHDVGLVYWLRIVFVADLAIVLLVSGFLKRPSESFRQIWTEMFRARNGSARMRIAAYVAGMVLIFFVTTVPDEVTDWLAARTTLTVERSGRPVFAPTAWLLEGHVNYETGERTSPFSRNLDLWRFDFRELLAKPDGSGSKDNGEPKRGRTDEEQPRLPRLDLRYALLSGASFRGLDLKNVLLERAVLFEADLRDAVLADKSLRGTIGDDADLRGAELYLSDLTGASFRRAQFQGAQLIAATLSDADLRSAQLQGANLSLAKLRGADLRQAKLQAARLYWARLDGADLQKAALQGVDLRRAELWGAILGGAGLQGADLRSAVVWHTEPPDQSFALLDHADSKDLIAREPSARELATLLEVLRKTTDKKVRARLAGDLDPLLDNSKRKAWRNSPKHHEWTKIGGRSRPVKTDLCRFLTQLACGEDSTVHIAKGVASRALLASEDEDSRVDAPRLAKTLLAESCKSGTFFSDDTRVKLQKVAREAVGDTCEDTSTAPPIIRLPHPK